MFPFGLLFMCTRFRAIFFRMSGFSVRIRNLASHPVFCLIASPAPLAAGAHQGFEEGAHSAPRRIPWRLPRQRGGTGGLGKGQAGMVCFREQLVMSLKPQFSKK